MKRIFVAAAALGAFVLGGSADAGTVGATVGEFDGATSTLTVPEPGDVAMLGVGFAVLAASRRRERRVACA